MQETKLSEIQSSQVSFMSIKALYIWFGVILTFLVAYTQSISERTALKLD